jgi:hypothetical protein
MVAAMGGILSGCGSSVTGYRGESLLAEIDTVGVESAVRYQAATDRLVVLATGQHTWLDADFDLFVAIVVPHVVPGVDCVLSAADGIEIIVIRNSSEVHAFVMQYFKLERGEIRWQSGRPVVTARAVTSYPHGSSLRQVPRWVTIETTLRPETDPRTFDRQSAQFRTKGLLNQQARGPLEQVVRVLRALDKATDDLGDALEGL